MATASVLIQTSNSTDADFRTWVNGIHNAIASLGTLVQTADTGQFDLVAGTRSGGYEVWRFNDALQATSPFLLRIRYFNFGLQISFGIATDGATNWVGSRNADLDTDNLNNYGSTQIRYLFSSDASRFSFWVNADSTIVGAGVNSFAFAFERSLDSAGAATGDGLVGMTVGGRNNMSWVTCGSTDLPYSNGPTNNYRANLLYPYGNSTVIQDRVVAYPWYPVGKNYQIGNPLLSFLTYYPTDFAVNQTASIERYGTARTYTAPNVSPTVPDIGTQLLMLWE